MEFLRYTNGGKGVIGKSYLSFWKVEELEELNIGYDVREFASGLVIIGSDGGGLVYGKNTNNTISEFDSIPFIGMDWEELLSNTQNTGAV